MKIIKNKKILIIIILILLAVVAICLGFVFSSKGDTPKKEKENKTEEYYSNSRYDYSDEVVEPTGTEVVKNESMSKEHCLNNICVSDAVFYSNDEMGRVECKVTNRTSKTATGFIKLNFGSNSLIVTYEKLKPGKSVNTTAEFFDMDFGKVEDFTLEELTEEELSNIITE